jgi:hypothetical protein
MYSDGCGHGRTEDERNFGRTPMEQTTDDRLEPTLSQGVPYNKQRNCVALSPQANYTD